jgi:hypothetical protein
LVLYPASDLEWINKIFATMPVDKMSV